MPKIARRPHLREDGSAIKLEGKVRTAPPSHQLQKGGWAERLHPDHGVLAFDEEKMRASYIADRRRLVPFIVPHRFEAKDDYDSKTGEPTNLGLRKRIGFGIGLNQAYLSEIMGHISSAPVTYGWGPLAPDDAEGDTVDEPPVGTLARRIWEDVTREGTSWRSFFLEEVLEWQLTSPGGFVLLDVPPGDARSEGEEERMGKRPFARFVPWSVVEDWGTGDTGFRWIKLHETRDERGPKDDQEQGFQDYHLLYELNEQGETVVGRYDDQGNLVQRTVTNEDGEDELAAEEQNMGRIEDLQGDAMLPLIPVRFGSHPDVPYAGDGLLRGLDDIVIDLWNQVSEIREEHRDIVFSFIAYAGDNLESVAEQFERGTRLVHYGSSSEQTMDIMHAPSEGVSAGIAIVEMALSAWALTAKRKAEEAVSVSGPRSGESIKAEFAVDIKPLLIGIADAMDTLELRSMHVMAQLAGFEAPEAGELRVLRDRDFQVEEESLRISKIVAEFKSALPRAIPGALQAEIAMNWAESLPFVDLSQEIETEGGEMVPLREIIRRQAEELAEAAQAGARNDGPFGGSAFPNLNQLEGE